MRIKKIEIYQLDLPYAGGVYHLSGGREYQNFDATFARIVTQCGLEGWGESTPFGSNYVAAHARGVRSGIDEIAPHLIGQDPREYEGIGRQMDRALKGHQHAKTPLDVACWDIIGKAYGQPIYRLLGGSSGVSMPLISSIPAALPEQMRADVEKHRRMGYRGHSIKIGANADQGGPHLDAERITQALADKKAGEFFLVDANGGLSVEAAVRMIRLLPPALDFVLEAPVGSWAETIALRKHCPVPILLDELIQTDADIALLVQQNAADGIGLKISKAGGLSAARRHRDMAQAAGLTVSVQDTVGSQVAFAAIAHLGQTVSPQLLSCILDTRDMVNATVAKFDAPLQNGGIIAPDTPGLGITINRALFEKPVAVYD